MQSRVEDEAEPKHSMLVLSDALTPLSAAGADADPTRDSAADLRKHDTAETRAKQKRKGADVQRRKGEKKTGRVSCRECKRKNE